MIKERIKTNSFLIILLSIVLALTLVACKSPTKSVDEKAEELSQNAKAQEETSRIHELIKAWTKAGFEAKIEEIENSSTLNKFYGSVSQHVVVLDGHKMMVFEYDLKNLNSTGERYLKFADDNGYDSKTSDPVWHNQEFLLRNTYAPLVDGSAPIKYIVKEHPKSVQILDAFRSFK